MTGAVILAAGKSSRMGQSKPLLRLQERTLLEWVMGSYNLVGIHENIVVVPSGHEDIITEVERLGGTPIVNPDPDSEMFASVQLGIRGLSQGCRSVFLQPVDIPLIGARVLRSLQAALAECQAWSVAPGCKGRKGHPLLLNSKAMDEVRKAKQNLTLRDIIKAFPMETHVVPTTWQGVLVDCDYPDDLDDLNKLVVEISKGAPYHE